MVYDRASFAPFGFTLMFLPLSTTADIFNIAWDNDLFTGSDRGYTNGVGLSYLTSSAETSDTGSARLAVAARDHLSFLPGIGSNSRDHALSFSLRQLMVTPEDLSRTEPQFNDIPYAGYLSVGATLWSWDADRITGFGAQIGVVGPESGAKASQKLVHKITGSEPPKGWDNQLGTDVVGGLTAEHGRKLWQFGQPDDLEQQFSAVGSGILSSFQTSASAGAVWRIGRNLSDNFIPDYAGSSSTIALPGSFSDSRTAWSVFVGLGVEYIAYSYLENNSGPYRFSESPLLGQIGLGATRQWDNLQMALVFRAKTGEKQRNQKNFSFGTLSFSWAL
ncbi:lipid A deacylase LpxR family protein [Marinobacter adhaerens]|jgi:hypothetical protein|nr:lipid A deacylase LpxR family protein [Marinobacter adhaerens]MCR9190000.1 lipid A deacylase LpxR family protein [Alteromonadaceae bacterium]